MDIVARRSPIVLVFTLLTAGCGNASSGGAPNATPVEPRKLADVPGTNPVSLHLYVSNQSFDPEVVDIQLWLNGTQVLEGDFAVEGQHNFVEFEVQVPRGALELHAEAFNGMVVFDTPIEVPEERWGYLDFWYYPDEDDAPSLKWHLWDEFQPFQ